MCEVQVFGLIYSTPLAYTIPTLKLDNIDDISLLIGIELEMSKYWQYFTNI